MPDPFFHDAAEGLVGSPAEVQADHQISDLFFASLPTLSHAIPSPGTFELSWPASAAGLTLQSTADLRAGAWTPVFTPVSLLNGQNQVQITPLPAVQFYRLSLP